MLRNTGGWRIGMLFLWAFAIFSVSGCDLSIFASPTPSPDYELTRVVGTLDVLRSRLDLVAPTLTSAAQNPKALITTPLPTHTAVSDTPTSLPESAPTATTVAGPTKTDSPAPISQPTSQPTLAATQTSSPQVSTAAITPTVVAMPKEFVVVYQDDFSSKRGWFQGETDEFSFKYDQGGYRGTVNVTGKPVWSVRKLDAGDVLVEIDAIRLGGAEDGYFGLVCRQAGAGNYYLLIISPDGQAEIAKVKNYQMQTLEQVQNLSWMAARQEFHIRADCIGDQLTLYVNNEILLQASDSDFTTGGVGLVAGNRSKSGTDILFDNFVVLSPQV